MNKYFFRQLTVLISGLLLTNVAPIFGQVSDTPTGNKVDVTTTSSESAHKGELYEHGYNKGGLAAAVEIRDSVMVGSVMNYFVMPNKSYNPAYFATGQNDYAATTLTSSEFVWSLKNGLGAAAPQNANPTTTSPWVKIAWGLVAGIDTIAVVEKPTGLSLTCKGDTTKIPVVVIDKPTVGFNQVGSPLAYADSECSDEVSGTQPASYEFPFNVTTSSSQVEVELSIVHTDLAGNVSAATTSTEFVTLTLISGINYTGAVSLDFSAYGEYAVTITKITDRVARKCDVEGDINAGQNVFTYSVLPQPKTGPIYHVPNLF